MLVSIHIVLNCVWYIYVILCFVVSDIFMSVMGWDCHMSAEVYIASVFDAPIPI